VAVNGGIGAGGKDNGAGLLLSAATRSPQAGCGTCGATKSSGITGSNGRGGCAEGDGVPLTAASRVNWCEVAAMEEGGRHSTGTRAAVGGHPGADGGHTDGDGGDHMGVEGGNQTGGDGGDHTGFEGGHATGARAAICAEKSSTWRCRRRSRIPANCWPKLRTAAVNCAVVMTKLGGVAPWGNDEDGAVEDEESASAMVDDGGGGGGWGAEVAGGPDISDTRCYERGGIERIVEEEEVAADALQYPRCYNTTGTVHEAAAARARERRLGLGALGTPAAGLRPRPAREKGFPSNLLLD